MLTCCPESSQLREAAARQARLPVGTAPRLPRARTGFLSFVTLQGGWASVHDFLVLTLRPRQAGPLPAAEGKGCPISDYVIELRHHTSPFCSSVTSLHCSHSPPVTPSHVWGHDSWKPTQCVQGHRLGADAP